MSNLHPYQDRKKLKWQGFFLSEHTAELAKLKKQQEFVVEPRQQMEESEIHEILNYAVTHNKMVSVQLNECFENKFKSDITGRIDGYRGIFMFIGSSVVDLENIRNVEIHTEKKWSNLD